MEDNEEVIDVPWVNNTKILVRNLDKTKPCKLCGYCPYGGIVELFRLRDENDDKFSCKVFGHDCPMFYNAEGMTE